MAKNLQEFSGASQLSAQHGKGSCKGEKGKGKSEKGKGKPDVNKNSVRTGKHSRFSRHLQRVAVTKHIAELIVFTGRVDVDELKQFILLRAQQPVEPLAQREDIQQLKIRRSEVPFETRQIPQATAANSSVSSHLKISRLPTKSCFASWQRARSYGQRTKPSWLLAMGHCGTRRAMSLT